MTALLWGNLLATRLFAGGDVTLAAPFCDGAILQQQQPVAIWGSAGAHERIRVEFAGQDVQVFADEAGSWRATLGPMMASGEPRQLVVTGRNVVTVKDVLVGEVWLCSGQSNMEWALRQIASADREIPRANYPRIRQFNLKSGPADHPVRVAEGRWVACTEETAGSFMATAYFFAREVHARLGVPVGLIKAAVGGSPIEAWVGSSMGMHDEMWSSAWKRWAALKDVPPERVAKSKPGVLYNGLVRPLEPISLAGVLWYQGEANVARAAEYQAWLAALIGQWRDGFGRADLPFLIAQLPKYQPKEETQAESWAWLRAAQAAVAASIPNAHLAVTLDVGEENNIHPHNKQEVGRRLAWLALAVCYRQPMAYSGPVFERLENDAGSLRLHFRHDAGLHLAGNADQCFELAGPDRRFLPAEARIEDRTVMVSSRLVPQPVAVRYAWRNVPTALLFNQTGLPAAPFRSDDW